MAPLAGPIFRDRRDAGQALARALQGRAWRHPIVLALPRGGVPVGAEVARALDAPLDVLVVRKIGHPQHPEFAVGAIGPGGVRVMNPGIERTLGGVPPEALDRIVEREQAELRRREAAYRDPAVPLQLAGRDVIVVDDGLATGATMQAAVQAVRALQPARIVVGVPLGARDSCATLARIADEVVCVEQPEPFYGVGAWYLDFAQTTDDEVRTLLRSARQPALG